MRFLLYPINILYKSSGLFQDRYKHHVLHIVVKADNYSHTKSGIHPIHPPCFLLQNHFIVVLNCCCWLTFMASIRVFFCPLGIMAFLWWYKNRSLSWSCIHHSLPPCPALILAINSIYTCFSAFSLSYTVKAITWWSNPPPPPNCGLPLFYK